MATAKGDRRARFRDLAPVERDPLVDRETWSAAARGFVEAIGLDPRDVEYFSSSADGEVYVSVVKRDEDGFVLEPVETEQIVFIWAEPTDPEPPATKGGRK